MPFLTLLSEHHQVVIGNPTFYLEKPEKQLFGRTYRHPLVGISIWLATAFSDTVSDKVEAWTGLGKQWMWVPLALVAAHLFFKAMHERSEERFKSLKGRIASGGKSVAAGVEDRLKEVRALLKRQADLAPSENIYTEPKAGSWVEETNDMLASLVVDNERTRLANYNTLVAYEYFYRVVTSLRVIAAGLRVEDLA